MSKDLTKRLRAIQQLTEKEMTFDDIKVIFEEFIKLRHDLPTTEKDLQAELNETAGDLVIMLHDDTDPEYDSSDARQEIIDSMGHLIAEFDQEKHFKLTKNPTLIKKIEKEPAKVTAVDLKPIETLVKEFEKKFKRDAFDDADELFMEAQSLLNEIPDDKKDLKKKVIDIAKEMYEVLVEDAEDDKDLRSYVKEMKKQYGKIFGFEK